MTATKSTVSGEVNGEGEGGRRKKTRGRQKIEMKAIEDKNARQVCFSKSRDGVFKKASELSVLCGAHLAVLFFSPAGNSHSFAHSSIHSVADRFLLSSPSSAAAPETTTTTTTTQQEEEVVNEFNRADERLTEAIEAEARRKDALDEAARVAGVWTDDDVRRAGVMELVSVLAALEKFRAEASRRVDEIETMLHHYAAAAMEDDTLLIGGHVPPRFAPVMMAPHFPPHFDHGGFGYSGLAGAGGYGCNFEVLDYGHGRHGAGEYYETETTMCHFFG